MKPFLSLAGLLLVTAAFVCAAQDKQQVMAGKISQIQAGSITITNSAGQKHQAKLADSTTVRGPASERLTQRDLQQGDQVVITASRDNGQAESIQKAQVAHGTIRNISSDGSSFEVQTSDNKTIKFQLPATRQVADSDGKDLRLADLNGKQATCYYYRSGESSMCAAVQAQASK